MTSTMQPTLLQKVLAWFVHILTASGLIAGFMALIAAHGGDLREAMLWLILAFVIDGVDGTFARKFRVTEVLPYMDGKTIDYVVDFFNFAIAPAYMFYLSDLTPESWRLPLTAIILLVSALYYGKTGMVSEDKYFVGFPVLWNMVVYFLIFIFDWPDWLNAFTIVFFAIAHFIPLKYIYPSQARRWQKISSIIGGLFFILMCIIVYIYPEKNIWLNTLSVIGWFYFAAFTFIEHFSPSVE